MPRRLREDIQRELREIEALIAPHPEGISQPALRHAFAAVQGHPLTERALLRRLAVLVAEDRVRVNGAARSTVYVAGPGLVTEAPAPEEGYVPLSREGAQVRALVRRPMIERRPVGYRREFLESYRPGRSWYLPLPLRTRLHEMGRTPNAERPAGTYAREILGRLLIDLAWASSRLEGNRYTRLDTRNLIEFGQQAEGTDARDAQMILNHKAAIELLVEEADHVGFNLYTFQSLHAALSENLIGDASDEGKIRTRPVDIAGTAYRPPGIPQQISECFRLVLTKADAITDPFEQAFFVMVHIPYLQPFVDVNKRTSRLGANLPLIKANLCPLSFVGMPEQAYVEGTLGIYELNRVELLRDVFAAAYERSCAQYRVERDGMGEPDTFRLRYRNALSTAVRETVQSGDPPQREMMRKWAERNGVPEADREPFAELALELLVGLHEGSLRRFNLLPSEFQAWRSRFPAPG